MTDELIERFFNRQCTPGEADEVSAFLKANPDVLEKYLGAKEWFGAGSQPMPDEFWNGSWAEIKKQRASPVRYFWLKAAVAAAIVLSAGGLLYSDHNVTKKPAVLASIEKTAAPSSRKITANNTAQVMMIVLPDSSRVALSPGSLITCNVPFTGSRREITLDGEARFVVMKNEHSPFTVFAGGLATTALGTEFTISTKNNVSVKLHNGRVMITATGNALKHWEKNIILEPGQQLDYSETKMTASVGMIRKQNGVVASAAVKKPTKAVARELPGMNFVNASLPDVMDRLMEHYHQTITFDSSQLDHMNFTGAISPSDSLSVVLKIIAQMNDLQLDHNENGYELKKEGE